MNFSKNRSENFKKNIYYGIFVVLILALAVVLSYGDIKNLSWKDFFDKVGVSDNTTKNYDSDMSVHFLDVGKADCAYIECDDHSILIDAADKEPTDTVVEYLKRREVTKLDLVIASHPHRDHIGQMDKVIKEFEINRFIEPDIPKDIIPTSVTYENMLKALIKKNVNIKVASPGESFDIGDMKVEIFGPISKHENINNNSVITKITYGSVSFLFMGDAEKSEESDLINSEYNLNSTVLKIGHHGSNTSSTYKFLGKVNPDYAVISVGPDKSNLPKEKVLERIKKFCGNIYRTDESGTVIFLTDGKEIKVKTEK